MQLHEKVEPSDRHATEHAANRGHDEHADHSRMYRNRFWLSLLLAIPVVFHSDQFQEWFGYQAPRFAGRQGRCRRLAAAARTHGGNGR